MYLFNHQPSNFYDYFHFHQNLDDNKISEIFKLVSNIDSNKAATVENGPQNLRNSQVKWIPLSEYTKSLFSYLENIINKANKSYFNFDISYSLDSIQYTEYHSSQNQYYDWHTDNCIVVENPPKLENSRKLSLTIQLSDPKEYEGGDLEISIPYPEKNIILKAPKEKGKIVIFPSYMWHRVTPVTKGTRKSLVWWVGGTPFR